MDNKIKKLINEFYEKVSYVINYQSKERSGGTSDFGLVIYNSEEIISSIIKEDISVSIKGKSSIQLFYFDLPFGVIHDYNNNTNIEINEENLIKFFNKFNIYENQGNVI